MFLTLFIILALSAFVTCILSAIGRCPIWVSVLLLAVIELLRALPMGR